MKSISYINDFEQWRNAFEFYIPINIRFSETDMFGHVNNVSPFIYFEEARIEYLKKIGLFGDLSKENDTIPIAADLQCDYHKQMFFNDQIKLYVKVNQIGNTSLDMHYMAINQDDEVCLTGRGRLVQINQKTGKPTPFSDEVKKTLFG
ncbi:acyl-CoA thioesterase [Aquibacillus sp. 3ASR75-11]|uniref:Acyl-CoA thioesterase n=1 Tax=Terrihalobacillus insolitus TaxID=2950438 RepID=A0A9X4ALM6_9BACI|nr:thioesterase family protein [Terrihalobacillus insolitus]MDC3412573.1 acyl-CoA thioesterase [Terrihalobacillus insolitus]MDC3423924.1 acyl-CoA thioesterase [Terrihalobacillus insolitus]